MGEPRLIDYKDRDTWLAHRSMGIGASEMPILFGVAPATWGSIYSLWLEKTGQQAREPIEGEYLEIGTAIEPTVAALYESRTGRKLWTGGGPFCVAEHPRLHFLRATPDRFVAEADGKPGVGDLQIKNAGWYKAQDWEDAPPDAVQIQVQTEIACMGVEWGSAAALIGGNAFRFHDLDRDPSLIAEIEAQAEWFWGLVERREPPPIDGSPATTRALKLLHPLDTGGTAILHAEAIDWLDDLLAAKERAKADKKVMDDAENKLRHAIGDATFAELPDGRRLSLKTTERKGYEVQPVTFRTLRVQK